MDIRERDGGLTAAPEAELEHEVCRLQLDNDRLRAENASLAALVALGSARLERRDQLGCDRGEVAA